MENITGPQLRAARALLGWSAEKLAAASGVSVASIRRAELLDGPVRMIQANTNAVIAALRNAGVEIFPENGGGAGVRFRRKAR